jgi:hypothetical protein
VGFLLLHNLDIYLFCVHFLIELGRKLGGLEEFRVHRRRHNDGFGDGLTEELLD